MSDKHTVTFSLI